MKLTERLAINMTIELWDCLAETGNLKEDCLPGYWPQMIHNCPLCEYTKKVFVIDCDRCPYYKRFGDCTALDSPYTDWTRAETKAENKKAAGRFLAQLRQL